MKPEKTTKISEEFIVQPNGWDWDNIGKRAREKQVALGTIACPWCGFLSSGALSYECPVCDNPYFGFSADRLYEPNCATCSKRAFGCKYPRGAVGCEGEYKYDSYL